MLAVEFKINLLAPARAPRFVARGRVLRAGRTLTACRADVFGIADDGSESLVAAMQSTIIVRQRRARLSAPRLAAAYDRSRAVSFDTK